MKNWIIHISLTCVIAGLAFMIGKCQSETEYIIRTVNTVPNGYIDVNSSAFQENYIDMRQVVGFDVTDNGLMLYFKNGEGYYWE